MFEDTAEEEPNAAWVYFTRATRLNLKPGTYLSTLSAYAVTLNYVLGLGCLGIPYAFFKAGLGFSIVVTCVAAFVSMLSTMWIVEVHMRAMILKTGRRQDRSWSDHSQQHHQTQTQTTTSSSTYATYSTTTVNTPPSSSFPRNAFKSPGTASQLTELLSSPHFFASTKSPVIEVASLVKGVLGKKVEILYMICLSGLAITGLWAYSNVAANSLVQQVRWKPCASPNFLGECGNAMTVVATVATVATTCLTLTLVVFFFLLSSFSSLPLRSTTTHAGWEYMINCAVFGIIVVPLSLLDTTEQATIQTIFTVLRFVTLGAMAISSLLGIFLFPVSDGFPLQPAQYPPLSNATSMSNATGPPYYGKDVTWTLQTGGMGLLISSMCFSMLFQHSVPGLMAAVDPNQRKSVKHVFGAALISSALLYIVLGVTMALYFGASILPSSNLNFVNFNFGLSTVHENNTMLANIISYVIVLFPVVGSISVYPLITITLSNNLHVSTSRWTGWAQDDQKAKIIWRLVAGIPPILLSLVVRNLSTIIQFSGIFAVPIAYLFPALLQLYSKKGTEAGLEKLPKEFTWHFNRHSFYPLCMMVVGTGCWALVAVQLVQHLMKL